MCNKLKTTVSQRLVTFDVGPEVVHKKLKGGALTLLSSSPFYVKGRHYKNQMLTAYSCFGGKYKDFLNVAKEYTGLDITEYETYYTLQFTVDMTDGKISEKQAIKLLTSFVKEHFGVYDPDRKCPCPGLPT